MNECSAARTIRASAGLRACRVQATRRLRRPRERAHAGQGVGVLQHDVAPGRRSSIPAPPPTAPSAAPGSGFPQYLMTYAEVQFMHAEAAERGGSLGAGTGGVASIAPGISASMDQWGVPTRPRSRVPRAGRRRLPGRHGRADQIAQQKWIALSRDGGQAWAEWRRTCQPRTSCLARRRSRTSSRDASSTRTTETEVNESGMASALTNQGPDDLPDAHVLGQEPGERTHLSRRVLRREAVTHQRTTTERRSPEASASGLLASCASRVPFRCRRSLRRALVRHRQTRILTRDRARATCGETR